MGNKLIRKVPINRNRYRRIADKINHALVMGTGATFLFLWIFPGFGFFVGIALFSAVFAEEYFIGWLQSKG